MDNRRWYLAAYVMFVAALGLSSWTMYELAVENGAVTTTNYALRVELHKKIEELARFKRPDVACWRNPTIARSE